MSEYKYRLINWILLRDIMSGNIILAEQIMNQALDEVTKWPYSPAITQIIESCKDTISQDGFELNFISESFCITIMGDINFHRIIRNLTEFSGLFNVDHPIIDFTLCLFVINVIAVSGTAFPESHNDEL